MVGVVFAVVGAVNLGTALIPLKMGDTNWEVAAFGEMASSLALPTLGAVLLGFTATRQRRAGVVLTIAVWLALLGTLAGFGAVILGLDIPLVLQVTRGGGEAQTQLRTLVGKSILLLGLYTLALWILAGNFALSFGKLRRVS
jgi:tellurite resistance protein TehA-like permease